MTEPGEIRSPFHGPAFDALQARQRAARVAVDETRAAYQSAKRALRQPQLLHDAAALSMAREQVLAVRIAHEDAKRDHRAAQATLHLYMREHMVRRNYGRRPSTDA